MITICRMTTKLDLSEFRKHGCKRKITASNAVEFCLSGQELQWRLCKHAMPIDCSCVSTFLLISRYIDLMKFISSCSSEQKHIAKLSKSKDAPSPLI